jgi:hypothetical protein
MTNSRDDNFKHIKNEAARPRAVRDAQLYNNWLEFHVANPQIYKLYCKYVDKVIDRGFKKCNSTTIWSAMNWDLAQEAGIKRIYALPKKYGPYYARYWMERHPEHPKFFKKRSKTIGLLTS